MRFYLINVLCTAFAAGIERRRTYHRQHNRTFRYRISLYGTELQDSLNNMYFVRFTIIKNLKL